jgi:DNA-binding NarL/FixJ family response regulator
MPSSVQIPHDAHWPNLLSRQQCKVALLVARGLTNKEIARQLGLKEGTVKVHLHNIFVRLRAKSRHDLIVHGSKTLHRDTAKHQ